MNEISMQRLTTADVPALARMAKQTFFDTFTGTCTEDDMAVFLDQYYNESILAEEINSGIECYFAVADDKPVGYMTFKDENPQFPEIKDSSALELKRFYVEKDFHGSGIANSMMRFFLDHAVAQGYDVAYLGVWEFNFRAQKFYSKYGFVHSGHRHPFPIGETPQTDIYLWKFLS